jgi:RHS repeat-associated protein
MKKTLFKFLIGCLVLEAATFNVIDIIPESFKIGKLIRVLDDLIASNCYAFDFPAPDKAFFEGAKSTGQSFQTDTFTGSASFQYTVNLPAGRKGVQPAIDLVYSSQSANNGWCGVGWTLDTGSIYRSTKKGIPKYDNSDIFIMSMNGSESELVSIGGNEYRPNIESQVMKIYFNGNYWEITDKSGTKYLLGSTNNSIVTNSKGTYKWCINKVIDVFGNYMVISYTKDQGQIYLSQIKYTGNEIKNETPYCVVDFSLESRDDAPPNYRTGDLIVTAFRLKEIRATLNNVLMKKYVFAYAYSAASKRSLLTSIAQYGSDGITSLPPTVFSYKGNGYTFTQGSNWLNGFGSASTFSLSSDFNGDGLSDAVVTDNSVKVQVATSNKANFNSPQTWMSFSHPWQGKDGFTWIPYAGDFNGDGRLDICGRAFCWVSRIWITLVIWECHDREEIAINNGTGFNSPVPWTEEAIVSPENVEGLSVGDFNGDGLSDLGRWINPINSGDITNKSKMKVYISAGDHFEDKGYWIAEREKIDDPIAGDFNGDGLADIAKFVNGAWVVALCTGTGFLPFSSWNSNFGNGKKPFAMDVNSDGLTDAIAFDSNTGQWQAAISNGKQFIPSNDWVNNFGAGKLVLAGDFKGKAMVAPAFFDSSSGSWQVANVEGVPNDLLYEINNGIGGKTTVSYGASISTTSTPFILPVVSQVTMNDGMGNSYTTNYQFQGSLYDSVDKEFRGFNYVKITDAEGNYTETYFKQDDIYKGKPYKQEVKDAQGNLYSKTESSWQSTQPFTGVYFPYLAQTDTYIYDGDTTPRQTRSRFEYDFYGNPTKVVSEGEVGVNGDEKTQVTEYVYNTSNWIVATPKHAYLTEDAAGTGNKVSEKWFYYDNASSIDISPAKGTLTKDEIMLFNPITSLSQILSTRYSYDDYGNLISTTDDLGRTTTTVYDTLIHSYPVQVINALSQSVKTVYYGINESGSDGLAGFGLAGQVKYAQDLNNQRVFQIYDIFGRLIKSIGPLDNEACPATIYEYDLISRPLKLTKKVRSSYELSTAGYKLYYNFYDGLGRLIQTKSPAEPDPQNGQARQIISDIATFDSRGQTKERYFPYFAGESPSYITPTYATPHATFIYDAVGRLVKTTNPDNTYSTVDYSKWVTIATDENNHYKISYSDAYGRIIKVEEREGLQTFTTSYEYDVQGNLTQLTDDQNNITYMWYDSLGRKLKMDDPDMGVWTYEYDAVGNMIKQTDAKNQTLSFEYDSFNRITKKSVLNGQVLATYLYDNTGKQNSIGRLSKVTDQSGSTEFFYDVLGREIQSIKTISGSQFTVSRTYDALDRLVTLTYPDNTAVKYEYSQDIEKISCLQSGSNTWQSIISNIDYSPTGQIIKIQYGNGTETNYTYDPNSLRLSHLLTKNAGRGTTLQDLNYQFDNAGNVKSITDYINTATQNFVYDDLNRLTQASGNYGTFTYQYDSIGNILSKEGKTLSYGKNGKLPHAVTQCGPVSIDYDANGNMTVKGGLSYTYDVENRLIKVEDTSLSLPRSVSLVLKPGWNFISFPVLPQDKSAYSVLNPIAGKYDQISRYNSTTKQFEHFVNNSTYNQFNTLEYNKGYQIYVTSTTEVTLTITGLPDNRISCTENLKKDWNLIGANYKTQAVNSALKDVAFTRLSRYNKDTQTFEEYPGSFSELEIGQAYYLKAASDQTWTVNNTTPTTTFTYDGDGGRVKKAITQGSQTVTTTYIGNLYEVANGVAKKHIFAGANRICTIEPQHTYYSHSDHLGSSNVVTDETGSQVQLTEFTPYGSTFRNQGSDITRYKFTGKELDDSTGLYYYVARYYDPALGRFISADPTIQRPHDPQDLNRYAYCRNNPVRYTDPTGYSWVSKFFKNLFGSIRNNPWGFFGGLLGGIAFGFLGSYIATSFLAPVFSAGGITAGEAAFITGTEFGIGGFGAGFVGTLAGGGELKDALKAGAAGFGIGFVTGGIVGYTYQSGIQDFVHGFNSRQYNIKLYEQKINALRTNCVTRPDKVNKTIGSRYLSKNSSGDLRTSGAKHRFIEKTNTWEMGPGPGKKIVTSSTVEDLANWDTNIATQKAIAKEAISTSTTNVSASGLGEAMDLYDTYFVKTGMTYNALNHNSNYAVNSVIYGAGGDIPADLGWTPGFPNKP